MNSSEDNDVCGATVSDLTNNVWFLENHFYNIGAHAARVGGALPNTSFKIHSVSNRLSRKESGFQVRFLKLPT